MSRQNITTRKRGIYVKNQQQTEMAFQVNNQKFGISKHRSIQPDTNIWQAKWSRMFTLFRKPNINKKGAQNLSIFYRSGRHQCILQRKLWVWIRWWRDVLDTTLTDKVCQRLQTGLGTPVSSTNITDRHDIAEIVYIYHVPHVNTNNN
jgi:hypothetical protein